MAYDPPPQQPGGQPPEDRPEETPEETPPGSTVPIPSASDYPQPSSAGAYTTPMSPSEYPSSQQGGMQPPPGGYTPPPPGGYGSSAEGSAPSQGGYTPPSQGGYSPGGGYSPPPPPPMYSGPGMESAATTGQVGLQGLLQSYIRAVTRPSPATYEAELANGSWLKVFIGIGVVTIVSVVISLLTAGRASSAEVEQQLQQLRDAGVSEDVVESFRQLSNSLSSGGGPLVALILTVILFFLGAGTFYLLARVFGGGGSDFMTHCYLLSLSYTPIKVAVSLLGALVGPNPNAGLACGLGLLVLVLYGYMIYSAGVSMQVSQRLAPGRAQLVAFFPLILLVLFACLCIVGITVLGIMAASQ